MKTIVWVSTSFEGFHRWKDAPDDMAFLRNFHRHIFEVELGVEVDDDNREVEFFELQEKIDKYIKKTFSEHFEFSCEQIAKLLLIKFNASYVKVSEDGENGATISV